MNRFKETLDDLRQRPGAKQLDKLLLPELKEPSSQKAQDGKDVFVRLPYSSDPEPIVERWK